MDRASEAILAVKPVTFHHKIDKTNSFEFGLIAEEVAAVNPGLVARDKNGEVYTVRYEAVNATLLNKFLKEHKKVEGQQANIAELKSTVAQQRKRMEVLTAQLNEQAAQIQKVSAQLKEQICAASGQQSLRAGWSWGCVSAIGSNGRTSALLTHTARRRKAFNSARMKS